MKMKKLILAALAVALCAGMTGCNMKSSGEQRYTMTLPKKFEEKEGNVTTVTEYEWTKDCAPAGQVRKVNDETIYEDSDYEYSEYAVTFVRTHYEDGEVSLVEKIEQKYRGSFYTGMYSTKKYRGNDTEPYEIIEESYDEQNRAKEYVRKVDGTTVYQRSNYDYKDDLIECKVSGSEVEVEQRVSSSYLPGSSYRLILEITTSAWDDPQDVISVEKHSYDSNYSGYLGYKLYNGDDLENPVKEMKDYESTDSTLSYKTVWYDEDGSEERSVTTNQSYFITTVTVKY